MGNVSCVGGWLVGSICFVCSDVMLSLSLLLHLANNKVKIYAFICINLRICTHTNSYMSQADRTVPKEFVDSVAAQRDRLLTSFRNYRRMSGSSVVSWMSLKNMTLGEFAKLERVRTCVCA